MNDQFIDSHKRTDTNYANIDVINIGQSLYSFLQHENTIMMEREELSIDNIMGYKSQLLEKFNNIISQIDNKKIPQEYLDFIKEIQKAIKLNTALQQAQNLHYKKYKNELKEKLFNDTKNTKEEREKKCH